MKELIPIGCVGIFSTKVENPYIAAGFTIMEATESPLLNGFQRGRALHLLKTNELPDSFDVWYMPFEGGARRVTSKEIDWERSGVR